MYTLLLLLYILLGLVLRTVSYYELEKQHASMYAKAPMLAT
jgi:hypothetical protein